MNALSTLQAEQFLPQERVIAKAWPHAHSDALRKGGPGVVTRTSAAGAGDHWIWVRLDGSLIDHPFLASHLRREPTV